MGQPGLAEARKTLQLLAIPSSFRNLVMKGRTKNMVDEPVMPNTVKMMNMSHHLHTSTRGHGSQGSGGGVGRLLLSSLRQSTYQAVLHRGCCGRSAIHRSQNCCSWPLVGESALLPDDLLNGMNGFH